MCQAGWTAADPEGPDLNVVHHIVSGQKEVMKNIPRILSRASSRRDHVTSLLGYKAETFMNDCPIFAHVAQTLNAA